MDFKKKNFDLTNKEGFFRSGFIDHNNGAILVSFLAKLSKHRTDELYKKLNFTEKSGDLVFVRRLLSKVAISECKRVGEVATIRGVSRVALRVFSNRTISS